MPRLPIPSIRGRPLAVRPDLGAWIATLTALYIGYDSYTRNFRADWIPPSIDGGFNLGANFQTYQYAAELAWSGESFYEVHPPGLEDWAVYLYPPITTIVFTPFTWIDWYDGWLILVALNVIAGLAAALIIVRFVEGEGYQLGWTDVALIGALFLLSPFTFGTIYYGNINLILALAFVSGYIAMERDRERYAGVVFGLAALFKLFPAIVGVWMLRRRAWRGVIAAVSVGIGGLLLGLIAFGWDRTIEFFTAVVLDRSETASFVGGYPADGTYYITIQRPISQVLWAAWPDAPAVLLTPLAVLVAAGVLWVFYRDIANRMEWLFAIFATTAIAITIVPALQWYLVLLYFPMLPLLYLWRGPGRIPFIAGAILLFFNARPGSVHDWLDGKPIPWLIEPIARDIVTLATIQLYAIAIMLAACWWYRYRTRAPTDGAVRQSILSEIRRTIDR